MKKELGDFWEKVSVGFREGEKNDVWRGPRGVKIFYRGQRGGFEKT